MAGAVGAGTGAAGAGAVVPEVFAVDVVNFVLMSFTDFSNHSSALSSFLVGEGKGWRVEGGGEWKLTVVRGTTASGVGGDEERTCQCWLGGRYFMLLTRDSASHPDGRVQLAKRAWLRVQHARARRAVRKGRERHAANHAQRLVVFISFTLDRRALRRSLGRP